MSLSTENELAHLPTALGQSAQPTAQPRSENIPVLIVENHPVYAQGLVDIMPARFSATVVSDAALMRLALQGQRIEIVVLDLDLGDGSSGLQLLTELLAHDKKVIVCSGTASYGQFCMCARLGAKACLSKNETAAAIQRTLLKVHAGEDALAPEVQHSTGNPDDEIPPLSKREIAVLHKMVEEPDITNAELENAENICGGRIKGVVSSLLDKFKVKGHRNKLAAEAKRRGYFPGIQLTPMPRKPRSDKLK
jgi:DNA-binding NarL/FixJ family response regulator